MNPKNKRFLQDAELPVSNEAKEAFAKLLDEKYDYAFKAGDIVKGKASYRDSSTVYVDIGAKTLALLPIKELESRNDPDEIKEGETYEFLIIRPENDEGQLVLSRRRLAQAYAWKKLESMENSDDVIECEVTEVVKGGILVNILDLRGFVPSSHIRAKGSLEELIGQTLPFKVLSLNQQRNNIILSNKKVVADQQQEQRREVMDKLEEGLVIEGEVVRITDFGAFVDLGGVDGLLPLSQMSWRWVEHPSDVLAIGDKIKVEVIGIDADRNRISLSLKSQQADPWEEVTQKLGMGDQVEGTITRIKNFGAFVEIHPGVEALLPSRELQDFERELNKQLEPKESIKSYITKFNPEERRISLSYYPPQFADQGNYAEEDATV